MSAWIVSPRLITQLVAGAIRLGVITEDKAEKTGIMLTRANVRSIRARYGEYDDGARRVRPWHWYAPRELIDDFSLYKQVRHYNYQTCEYARRALRDQDARRAGSNVPAGIIRSSLAGRAVGDLT